MHDMETKMLLKHYLEQGLSKAELARRLGVSRRTIAATALRSAPPVPSAPDAATSPAAAETPGERRGRQQ